MNKKITQEQFLEVLEELRGNILIVEGRKDESALRSLYSGCSWLKPRGPTRILKISSRSLVKVAEDAVSLMEKHKNREVIILTDFDRTGSRLASRLRLLLQSRKVHANSRIRRDVMNLGIKCIEEMASVRRAMALDERGWTEPTASVSGITKSRERDVYVKTGTNFNKVRDKGLHKGKRDNRKTRRDRGDIRAD